MPAEELTGRQRVLRLIATQSIDRTPLMPITMQFASDLIGAKYRSYALDHRVLVEAQLRVAEKYGFDYVSCISDPAREAADCGAAVEFFEDSPPAIQEDRPRLADKARLATMKVPDPLGDGRMHDRVRAAALFKQRIGAQKLIEGWIEGPCAQAVDLRASSNLMLDFFDDPAFVRDLFEFVIEMELRFARAQVDAGIDIMGIGDAAASLVGPQIYSEFVWPYEKKLIDGVKAMGCAVRLHICGNTRPLLKKIGELGADIVDLDYYSPVAEARAAMSPRQVLLGNIHPVEVLRNGTPQQVRAAVEQCAREGGEYFIVGAGCEVPRDTPEANVRAMCDVAFARRFKDAPAP